MLRLGWHFLDCLQHLYKKSGPLFVMAHVSFWFGDVLSIASVYSDCKKEMAC